MKEDPVHSRAEPEAGGQERVEDGARRGDEAASLGLVDQRAGADHVEAELSAEVPSFQVVEDDARDLPLEGQGQRLALAMSERTVCDGARHRLTERMDVDPRGKLRLASPDFSRHRLGDRYLSKESRQQRELADPLEVDQAARIRYDDGSHESMVAFSRSHSSSVVR